jgi:phosphoribosylaminoimidazolecarboxamide formyltransferase/IMP cyclohydrolase
MSGANDVQSVRDDLKIKRALLTVYDKTGLVEFATVLKRFNVDLIATGGTLSALEKAGLKVTPLEKIGHFPEMLDGRVKTLQPEIFAGILARKPSKDHLEQISKHGIKPIDMVVCNFYAFEATAAKTETNEEELIEMIDIGGPSLVRASSKNFESVCIVPASKFYAEIQKELEAKNGIVSYATRRNMALKAFEIVAGYDIAIYNTLSNRFVPQQFPDTFFLAARAYEVPKYGENPDQKAMIYAINGAKGGIPEWRQLFGDPRSYNNYLDIASSFEILEGFENYPAAATVKHGQISGFAYSKDGLSDAYRLAHECDPEADFGNTTVLNMVVDVHTAKLIGKNDDDGDGDASVYTEIVLAPGYTTEALEILKAKQKKKMRLIQTSVGSSFPYDVKVIQGLALIQDAPDYRKKLDSSKVTVGTVFKPSEKEKVILLGLWELARRVESNAIVIGNGHVSSDGELTKLWTLGVGTFRKRNGATKIALDNAGKRANGAYCASDGFFPFPDSVEMLAHAGIKGIIQPGGSISDKKVIEVSNKYSIPLLITHERAFKH